MISMCLPFYWTTAQSTGNVKTCYYKFLITIKIYLIVMVNLLRVVPWPKMH